MEKNSGIVKLKNNKMYPFNNSLITVLLPYPVLNTSYLVNTNVIYSDGETGDILISDRAKNGFKICFTGSACEADIIWWIDEVSV